MARPKKVTENAPAPSPDKTSEPTETGSMPPSPVEQKKTVEVDANSLDAVLKKVEEQQAQIAKQQDQIGLLLQVADKSRLHALQMQRSKERPLTVRISRFEHEGKAKIVVGWTTQVNNVWQDPITRAWREDQQTELIFEDGTKFTVPYLVWVRNANRIECQVVGRKTDEYGETLEVLLPEGRKLFIDVKFVN